MKNFLFIGLPFICLLASAQTPARRPAVTPIAPVNLLDSSFYMVVEDAFDVQGKGLAVVGKISTGKVGVGQVINIMGFSGVAKVVTVSAIEKLGANISTAVAGDYVGLIFSDGISKEEVMRGMVAIATDFGQLDVMLVAEVKLYSTARTVYRDRSNISLLYNGKVIPNCEVVMARGLELRPGQTKQIKISCPVYLVLIPNLAFGIWDDERTQHIGTGKLILAAEPAGD